MKHPRPYIAAAGAAASLQLLQEAPTACQLAEEQAAAHAAVGYGKSCSTASATQGKSQAAKPSTLHQQMS
jgi:hypothetical protein